VAEAALATLLREAAERFARYWRKQAREPGAERELTRVATDRLEALKLVSRADGTVRPRQALARFKVAPPELRQRELGEA
jgi:hypothetical protein